MGKDRPRQQEEEETTTGSRAQKDRGIPLWGSAGKLSGNLTKRGLAWCPRRGTDGAGWGPGKDELTTHDGWRDRLVWVGGAGRDTIAGLTFQKTTPNTARIGAPADGFARSARAVSLEDEGI